MPLNFNEKALEAFLPQSLKKITSADPDVLATYVLALLKKDKAPEEIKKNCLEELEAFLEGETGGFVTDLFDTIEARSYLPAESPQKSSDGAARVKSEITAAGSLAGAPPSRKKDHGESDNDSEEESDRHHKRRSSDNRPQQDRGDSKRRRIPEDNTRRPYDDRNRGPPMRNGPMGRPGSPPFRGGQRGPGDFGGWNDNRGRDNWNGRDRRGPMHDGPRDRDFRDRDGGRDRFGDADADRRRDDNRRERDNGDEYDPEAALEQAEREMPNRRMNNGGKGYDSGKGSMGKGNWGGRGDFGGPSNFMMGGGMDRDRWDNNRNGKGGDNNFGSGKGGGKGMDYGNDRRGGSKGKGKGDRGIEMVGPASHQPTAICVREVPKELFSDTKMRSHFSQFGKIVDLHLADQKKTIFVTFAKHAAAVTALKSTLAVCSNRFITVDWARKQNSPEVKEDEAPVMEPESGSGQAEDKKSKASEKHLLIQSQIEHQKALVAHMETMKNLTPQEKLEMIRSLTKTMDQSKDQLIKIVPAKPADAPDAAAAPAESEAGAAEEAAAAEGEEAGDQAEITKLQNEYKQLQETARLAGIPVDVPSPVKPGEKGGKGGKGKGKGKGKSKGKGKDGAKKAAKWGSLDLRPKALAIKLPEGNVTDEALREHFGEGVAQVSVSDGSAVVEFANRRAAEMAMKNLEFEGETLSCTWHQVAAVSAAPAAKAEPAAEERPEETV